MKPKLYLHIGPPKTATSSIQREISRSADSLRTDHGLHLGALFNAAAGNHHLLAKRVRESGSFGDLPDENCLISSEALYHLFYRKLIPTEEIARLKSQFDVQIVFALRRQDFLKESVYAEVSTKWFRGPIERENHFGYRMNWFIVQLEKDFGRENIQILQFKDTGESDMVGDFFKAIGVAPPPPPREGADFPSAN